MKKMSDRIEKLTAQEEEAMLAVWRLNGGYIKDFLEEMPQPRPPYTTLASVVKNLERKGYVASQRFGNTYRYAPVVSETEYKRAFLSGVVRNYFANSYRDVVAFFAQEEKLTSEELQEILAMIEQGKEKK